MSENKMMINHIANRPLTIDELYSLEARVKKINQEIQYQVDGEIIYAMHIVSAASLNPDSFADDNFIYESLQSKKFSNFRLGLLGELNSEDLERIKIVPDPRTGQNGSLIIQFYKNDFDGKKLTEKDIKSGL